jgi:tetratricopeptide (TPR) repeat protein
MITHPWPRVKQVLEAALAAAPEEREHAIHSACEGDEELRRQVEEYLRYETRAAALLPATAWREMLPPEDQPAPEHVGPWRIVKEIGRGGMGVVYLAERDDGEYRQSAALKLVRGERGTPVFNDLFRHERQILAQVEHPNIARLLDGGTTPAGQPYYAMEFVEGEPLMRYVCKRAIPIAARLRLFLKVCDAVSHAHRRLIIHRDLKPGNVLVTEAGEPKLLDFGLAKVLDPTQGGDETLAGMPLLTPAYASPEQVRGEHLTTAADIYSLGVILYELISERLPYELKGSSVFEAWTAVCEQAPAAPSMASRHRLRAAADLDSIVLMALRKEPDQRYSSVEAMRADIERYLSGRPVMAREGSAFYRMRRFVTRHRWGVMAGATAVAGASVAFGVIWWEERRAEFRFQQLRQFARSVVFELHDSIEELPGATKARKLLVNRSLEYLRSLEASSGGDPVLKWELAEAYKRIGDAQGNTARPNLGDSTGALESFGRSRALLREIIAKQPGNLAPLNTLAGLDRTRADILRDSGKPAEALAARREASEVLAKVAARNPSLSTRKALALGQWNLAAGLVQVEDWPAAIKAWQQTLASFEDLARAQPGDLAARRNVALSHKRLGAVYLQQDDTKRALEHLRAAEQIDRDRLLAEPSSAEAKMDLSFDLSDEGLALYNLDRFRESVEKYKGAVELRRDAIARDPDDYRARSVLGRSLSRLAQSYLMAGDPDHAIEAGREAADMLAAVAAHDPANQRTRLDTATAFARLGAQYQTRAGAKDWPAALAAYQRAGTLLAGVTDFTGLTEYERARIAALPAAIEECRRKASRRP